eukprot:Nk52_evm4s303 gene=Nk52_evmTU4s303
MTLTGVRGAAPSQDKLVLGDDIEDTDPTGAVLDGEEALGGVYLMGEVVYGGGVAREGGVTVTGLCLCVCEEGEWRGGRGEEEEEEEEEEGKSGGSMKLHLEDLE